MLNKVTLIGNLGRDPELRTTPNGSQVCNLSLATTERVKRGDAWEEHTEWHRVVCFGRTAENVARFKKKGATLYVEGRIRTNKWKDKDGQDRYTTEIVADDVKFIGGERPPGGRDPDRYDSNATSDSDTAFGAGGDDIPF